MGRIKARAVACVISDCMNGQRHFFVFGGGEDFRANNGLEAYKEAQHRNLQLLGRLADLIENSEWNSDFRQVLVDELGLGDMGYEPPKISMIANLEPCFTKDSDGKLNLKSVSLVAPGAGTPDEPEEEVNHKTK